MECFCSEETVLQHTWRMTKNKRDISTRLPGVPSVLEPLLPSSSAWSFQILFGSCCSPLPFLPLLWLWSLLLVNLLTRHLSHQPMAPGISQAHLCYYPCQFPILSEQQHIPDFAKSCCDQIPSEHIFYHSPALCTIMGEQRSPCAVVIPQVLSTWIFWDLVCHWHKAKKGKLVG